MKYSQIPDGLEAVTQIRYNDPGAVSQLSTVADKVQVDFFANVRGVAPGQSAVFYEGDDVIGGDIIHGSFMDELRQTAETAPSFKTTENA